MGKLFQVLALLFCTALVKASRHIDLVNNSTTVKRVGSNITLACGNYRNSSIGKQEKGAWNWKNQKNNGSRILIPANGNTLPLTNLQIIDGGKYECTNPYENVLRWIYLVVGRRPTRPGSLSCVTHHTISHMNCCWDVGNYTGISTNYTLNYIFTQGVLDHHSWNWNTTIKNGSCSSLETNEDARLHSPKKCCDLPIGGNPNNRDRMVEFNISLQSKNIFGTVYSDDLPLENPLAWVKPIPPTNVTLEVKKMRNVYYITVNWNQPNMTGAKFEYNVKYRVSQQKENSWHVVNRIIDRSYTFQIRRSHSTIEVQVSAYPTGLYGGYSSDWSQLAIANTGDIPPMSTLRFNNVTTDFSFDTGLTIAVEWLQYGRQDELGFYYEISYAECNGEIFKTFNFTSRHTTHTQSINSSSNCISVFGHHCNAVGCTEKAQILVYPNKVPKFNATVQLNISENEFVATWTHQETFSGNCFVKIIGMARLHRNNSIVVVRKAIASENVLCSSKMFRVEKSSSLCMEYIAVISKIKVSNKLMYTRTVRSESEIKDHEELSNFENLNINVTNTPMQLQASWSLRQTPGCFSYLQPRIGYTAVDGAECFDKKHGCQTEYYSEPIGCNDTDVNIKNHIYGDTVYNVKVEMCCSTETSFFTQNPICYDVKETKPVSLRTPLSAPDILENFKWDGENKVLSWDTPSHPNGPISGYFISVFSVNNSNLIYNITSNHTSVKHIEICGTDEVTIDVEIRAFTRNEMGNVLYGEARMLKSISCGSGAIIHKDSVPVVVGSTIGILLVILGALIVYYNKKHIKNIITRTIWPSVPRPNIIVAFQRIETEVDEANVDMELHDTEGENIRGESIDEISAPLLSSTQTNHHTQSPTTSLNTREHNPTNAEPLESSISHTGPSDSGKCNEMQHIGSPPINANKQSFSKLNSLHLGGGGQAPNTTDITAQNTMFPHPYVKTSKDSQENCQSRLETSPASGSLYRTMRHGSTPSIPSYLSCSTHYPFSMGTHRDNSDVESVYARLPDIYQWTLPDYTALSIRSSYSGYSWTKLPHTSTPFDLKNGCRKFFDENHTEKDGDNNLETFQVPTYSGLSEK